MRKSFWRRLSFLAQAVDVSYQGIYVANYVDIWVEFPVALISCTLPVEEQVVLGPESRPYGLNI